MREIHDDPAFRAKATRRAPGSVPDFKIEGKEDDGGFEIGTGLSFTPSHANRLQFDLRYETYIASHTLDQNITARVLISF